MSKNPFHNAVIAAGYISVVAIFMFWVTNTPHTDEDNLLIPVGMISLLVLSAAIMAFTFFYQPILYLMEGKRTEAAKLLGRTIVIFACITIVMLFLSIKVF